MIVCVHTHRPYTMRISETLFVNVGSGGNPWTATRERPGLIETPAYGVSVDVRCVEYDVDAAAQAVLRSDLPDEFAGQLREGARLRHRSDLSDRSCPHMA